MSIVSLAATIAAVAAAIAMAIFLEDIFKIIVFMATPLALIIFIGFTIASIAIADWRKGAKIRGSY